MSHHKFAVYLGNLRPDVRAKHHKQNILHLFNALNVSIDKHDIEIVYLGKEEPAHAFVDLDNEREQLYVIQTLSDTSPEETEEFEKFAYDLLVIDGEELRITARNDKNLKKYGRHKKDKHLENNEAHQEEDYEAKLSARQSAVQARRDGRAKKRQSQGNYRYARRNDNSRLTPRTPRDERKEEDSDNECSTNELLNDLKPEKTYQEEWLERLQAGMGEQTNVDHAAVNFSDVQHVPGSETPGSGASLAGSEQDLSLPDGNLPERYYIRGERIGNESRTLEFKMQAGKLPKKTLKNVIGKYVVSFLNSAGGTLMLGVNDDGIAVGREFTPKEEDLLRLVVDEVMRGIQPLVLPDVYSISFIPVEVNGKFGSAKIVEIEVQPGATDQLYMTKGGEVYVRRDGSVQGPLKAAEVHQWNQGRLRRNQEELNQLRQQHSQLRSEIDHHRLREAEMMELLKARKNSKVCVIL